jgi:mannose-6-phosphate isomerase-like protein (cupin superfamily)
MRIEHANPAVAKGWYAGPWNSDLTISVGYANEGIDDPHLRERITEIFLIARGWADVRIERQTVRVNQGDLLIVEPGEAHTFLASSQEYFHFVVHVPGLPEAETRIDRVSVPHARLA